MYRVVAMVVGLMLVAGPVLAKKPGTESDGEGDVTVNEGHGKSKQKSLPPGLRKKLERGGELPPGWQMKLERGQVLDAGLEKQASPVSGDILGGLPSSGGDTEDLRIEDRVIRVIKDSRRIVDIFNLSGERQ